MSKGPLVYENWQTLKKSEDAQGAYEIPLFTDAPIEAFYTKEYGPYHFMNTGHPRVQEWECVPAIVLRIEDALHDLPGYHMVTGHGWHADFDVPQPGTMPPRKKSDTENRRK